MSNANEFLSSLGQQVDAQWEEIKRGQFWRLVMSGSVTRELYRDLMVQVYHYSRHNSMNQACAAFVPAPQELLKFVYDHAREEWSHEKMVVNDLRSINMFAEADLEKPPLPATEGLIGYLYFVALRYGPIPRLGYSFWAEDAHRHIAEAIAKISVDLNLTSDNLKFFGSHAELDEDHFAQVKEALARYATRSEDQELVVRVATTTLSLTGQLLDQVARKHL